MVFFIGAQMYWGNYEGQKEIGWPIYHAKQYIKQGRFSKKYLLKMTPWNKQKQRKLVLEQSIKMSC